MPIKTQPLSHTPPAAPGIATWLRKLGAGGLLDHLIVLLLTTICFALFSATMMSFWAIAGVFVVAYAAMFFMLRFRRARFDAASVPICIGQPLLHEIDKGFSEAWWANYRALVARREAETIASDELRELSALTDTLEEYNVRRMACFESASRLMGTSLDELMKEFALKPKAV